VRFVEISAVKLKVIERVIEFIYLLSKFIFRFG